MVRLGISRAAMFAEPTVTKIEKMVCLVHGNSGQWSVVSVQISEGGGQTLFLVLLTTDHWTLTTTPPLSTSGECHGSKPARSTATAQMPGDRFA